MTRWARRRVAVSFLSFAILGCAAQPTADGGEPCGSSAACEPGQTCQDGACVFPCGDGLTACAGECVDTRVDPANCGACGNVCAPSQICDGQGACRVLCEAGRYDCGGRCVDIRTDRHHCGGCDVSCDQRDECIDGTCESLPEGCPNGTADFGGYCWVATTACDEFQPAACERVGLVVGPRGFAPLGWNEDVMAEVTSQLACVSLGLQSDAGVPGLWRSARSNECFTRGFGDRFFSAEGCFLSNNSIVLCARPQ